MPRPIPGFLSQYRNLLHHYVHQTGHEEASTFWCGCGAIRRAVFLDEPAASTAASAIRRSRTSSSATGCGVPATGSASAKDLQVTHLKRWTPLSLLRTDIFARAVPWTRLIIRSRVLPNDLNVRTSSRASVALVFVLAGRARRRPVGAVGRRRGRPRGRWASWR